ncbi:MAG: trypsin-like peptidase domain-containing protein [Methylophilaceae bacterium]|nr:trypsin-like peptidase domain-containing protein [Methyloradius sp.]
MKKSLTSSLLVLFLSIGLPSVANAQPTQEEIFKINESIVQVNAEFKNGSRGSGSGVVIAKDYVVTNCHVLADAVGVNIEKVRESYAPVSLQADWKHDLCLLKFEALPLNPVPMKLSKDLQNEQEIFLLGYPNDAQVPQVSYGSITALYPYDGSIVIRSSAAFAQGSSGGALFDQNFNLIGITTFKSPGRKQPYFYSLPVEWIKKLFDLPAQQSLHATENPFWNYAENERPFFMQIVIPYQQNQWSELFKLASAWCEKEPDSASAWFYLGVAEYHQNHRDQALIDLKKSTSLNSRNIEAYTQLAKIALDAGDKTEAQRMTDIIAGIDPDQAEDLIAHLSEMH